MEGAPAYLSRDSREKPGENQQGEEKLNYTWSISESSVQTHLRFKNSSGTQPSEAFRISWGFHGRVHGVAKRRTWPRNFHFHSPPQDLSWVPTAKIWVQSALVSGRERRKSHLERLVHSVNKTYPQGTSTPDSHLHIRKYVTQKGNTQLQLTQAAWSTLRGRKTTD